MYIYYGRGKTNTCQKNYHCSINNITELILTFVLAFKIFIAHGRKRNKQKKLHKSRVIVHLVHILWKPGQEIRVSNVTAPQFELFNTFNTFP